MQVVVPAGAGLGEIARHLADAGVIRSPLTFTLGVRSSGLARVLQAGEYAFGPDISARQAARLIASGRIVVRQFTLPEGLTTTAAAALLSAAPGLVGPLERSALPEGMLLPETYNYVWGDSANGMAGRMVAAMSALLDTLWVSRAPDLPLESPWQAVILASIVERETARDGERPLVASVFINRLRRNMRLQADPTVAYALAGPDGLLDRPLSRADLTVDSPYNTYRVRGLPPGPIANPGRAALQAVMQPAETDFLYFVADGAGGHLFAATLAEHNRNVRRLRALQAGDGAGENDQVEDGAP